MLPPPAGCCQICATEHLPELPHNFWSLFYQVRFKLEHGRDPSLDDAMGHCAPDVRVAWLHALERVKAKRKSTKARSAGGAT